MRYFFFLALLGIPISDIASLIVVGERIGVWPTIAAVLFAGLLGSVLIRRQGLTIVQQARSALRSGRFPAREVFNGLCVVIGGALLMFPGFVSDLLGLLLLTPPIRGLLISGIAGAARRSGRFEVFVGGAGFPGAPKPPGPVIEGEFRPVGEPQDPPPATPVPSPGPRDQPRSPWEPSAERPPPAVVVPPNDP